MVAEQLKQFKISTVSFSDKGKRKTNQDRILFSPMEGGAYLLGVIDGMGGYTNGELAAEIAKESFLKHLGENIDILDEQLIIDIFAIAHKAIVSKLDESGVTIAIVVIKDNKACIFWAGDVKVILISGDNEFVSKDHTLLNLLRQSDLAVKSSEIPRLKNTVVKSLGGKSESYIPEFTSFELPNNFFGFICSDGVHQLFSDNELLYTLHQCHTKGSLDDITARCNANATDNFSGIFFWNVD